MNTVLPIIGYVLLALIGAGWVTCMIIAQVTRFTRPRWYVAIMRGINRHLN